MGLDIADLFERYQGVVFRRCRALLRDDADAEEAVQEVFVAALSGLGRFRLRATPLPWLYGVATRHCLQRLRNQRTRTRKRALLHADDAASEARDLPAQVDLARFFDGLSPQQQELATLAFRDGLTQEEISAVMRLSRKTVGRKLAALARAAEAERLATDAWRG